MEEEGLELDRKWWRETEVKDNLKIQSSVKPTSEPLSKMERKRARLEFDLVLNEKGKALKVGVEESSRPIQG